MPTLPERQAGLSFFITKRNAYHWLMPWEMYDGRVLRSSCGGALFQE